MSLGSSFATGLSVLIGVSLAAFGPGLVLKCVYFLRTTGIEIFGLIRNVFVLAVLLDLTYKVWEFVTRQNLGQLPLTSIGDLLIEIARTVVS